MQWYIVHTYSGSEKRVKQMILDQAEKKNMTHFFEEIVIPMIEVPEVKRGKNVNTEKKFIPGYILIKMDMNDEAWHLVRDIPKVSKFLGGDSKPKPVGKNEIERIFSQLEVIAKDISAVKMYEIGEEIIVNEGPFEGFVGVVDEIDVEKQKLRVLVKIFGRDTPMELDYVEVRRKQD